VKPLIGITCSESRDRGRLHLNRPYATAVTAAGGLPLLLPEMRGMEGEYLKRLDGILLSGGGDIDPSCFGEEPHPLTGWISPHRDAFELELARLALGSGMPVLGICRGLQVLNIAAGGDICQDISLLFRTPLKHAQNAPRWHFTHGLQLLPGSHLANLLGGLEIRVNSFHHQVVGRVARGFSVTARSPDGVIEGLESQSGHALGVQFHPEEMWEREARFLNIFKSLIEKAALGRIKKQRYS
jgi:putative glutamine amidotransferase